jgi:hypothetical protein
MTITVSAGSSGLQIWCVHDMEGAIVDTINLWNLAAI